jgi:hypothetical protein
MDGAAQITSSLLSLKKKEERLVFRSGALQVPKKKTSKKEKKQPAGKTNVSYNLYVRGFLGLEGWKGY